MHGLLCGCLENIIERVERFGEVFGKSGGFDLELGETNLIESVPVQVSVEGGQPVPTAAFDVETQRQESLSCREESLSKGDSKGEGAVKAEAVLRARQSHS